MEFGPCLLLATLEGAVTAAVLARRPADIDAPTLIDRLEALAADCDLDLAIDPEAEAIEGTLTVHAAVRDATLAAYATLAAARPETVYVYGETGWPRGGRWKRIARRC